MRLMIVLVLLFSTICFADVYMQKNDEGVTTYSDTPSQNAEKIAIPDNKPVTLPPAIAPSTDTNGTPSTGMTKNASVHPSYKVFRISSPTDQETIQNQPSIPVTIAIDPPMQPGDKIQLFLDGKDRGTPTESTHLDAGLVERGTHTLSATIMDANGKVISQSSAVTIFVHHAANGK